MKYSDKDLEVLFCDRQVIAVNKPPNLVTQGEDSLEVLVKAWVCREEGREKAFMHPIHRLDKPVGGIVVFARTSKALSRLNESIREGKTEKTYLACVEGTVDEKGDLVHYLTHDSFHAKVFDTPKEGAKKARLLFSRMTSKKNRSLVKIELKTGRYHQIRAQFAHIGHPIIGDTKYGGQKGDTLFLHHSRFTIPHPVSLELLRFQSIPQWGAWCEEIPPNF